MPAPTSQETTKEKLEDAIPFFQGGSGEKIQQTKPDILIAQPKILSLSRTQFYSQLDNALQIELSGGYDVESILV